MLCLKLQGVQGFDTTLRQTDILPSLFSAFTKKKGKKNLTQCCSHKDLRSPELHQFGFRAARSIKTALLEVTKGLQSGAQSYFISLPSFHSTLQAVNQLAMFLLPVPPGLSAHGSPSRTCDTVVSQHRIPPSESPRAHSVRSDLCGPFSCNIKSVLSSSLLLYALLLL